MDQCVKLWSYMLSASITSFCVFNLAYNHWTYFSTSASCFCFLLHKTDSCNVWKVCCGNRIVKFRTTSNAKVDDWISAINDAVLKPPEGWCNPHRFGSFAPLRGTNDDATQAQWFIDGKAAFEAIASSIESAKSEVDLSTCYSQSNIFLLQRVPPNLIFMQIYITGWWLCPELYLRRPFHNHSSSRLDALLETKAKEGVQVHMQLISSNMFDFTNNWIEFCKYNSYSVILAQSYKSHFCWEILLKSLCSVTCDKD